LGGAKETDLIYEGIATYSASAISGDPPKKKLT